MKPGRTVEMPGAWKTEENQTQVSLRFPQPLEIAARFPHSHRPGGCLCSKSSKSNSRKETLAADRFAPTFRLILQRENAPLPADPRHWVSPIRCTRVGRLSPFARRGRS